MASNSQQFSARNDVIVLRGINDATTDSSSSANRKLEGKLDTLVTYAANIYNNRLAQQQQQNFDLSSNRYKPGWRNHPNLRWGNSQQQQNQAPFQNHPLTQNKIDVYAGTLSMEFGDSILHFNILDAMKHPSEDHSVFRAEIHDDVVDEYASDFYSLHDKKHCFLSDLYNSLACTESASEFDFESVSVSDFDSCSKNKSDFVSDVLGAVLSLGELESSRSFDDHNKYTTTTWSTKTMAKKSQENAMKWSYVIELSK
uniref:Uncharacterized protein n=1 Tax=Cajanus cajan TaxID=3821 RepID=A0A151UDM1_CAJCA